MTSRSDEARRNRELMPNVAELVDEWREEFPGLKVIYAHDRVTGYEVGEKPKDEATAFSIPHNYFPSTPVDLKKGKRK